MANQLQSESCLVAVTVFGMTLGNLHSPDLEELTRFKEYITVLVVSGLFILLKARLDPSVLSHLNWRSLALILVMLLIIRPCTVWSATLFSTVSRQEKLLLSWIAPRGIVVASVAGIFGQRMMEAGYADASMLVPIVFSLVFVTVLLHGFTIEPFARRLGLAVARERSLLIVGATDWSTALARALQQLGLTVILADTS